VKLPLETRIYFPRGRVLEAQRHFPFSHEEMFGRRPRQLPPLLLPCRGFPDLFRKRRAPLPVPCDVKPTSLRNNYQWETYLNRIDPRSSLQPAPPPPPRLQLRSPPLSSTNCFSPPVSSFRGFGHIPVLFTGNTGFGNFPPVLKAGQHQPVSVSRLLPLSGSLTFSPPCAIRRGPQRHLHRILTFPFLPGPSRTL